MIMRAICQVCILVCKLELKKSIPLLCIFSAQHTVCAAECCPEAASFFLLLQHIHNFFSASTSHWSIFQSNLKSGVSVKRPSETRWSGRHDACYSLSVNWTEIISSSQVIQNDKSQKATVKCEATGILRSLQCLETAVMTSFWSAILKRFNSTNKLLQRVDIDIGTVIKL